MCRPSKRTLVTIYDLCAIGHIRARPKVVFIKIRPSIRRPLEHFYYYFVAVLAILSHPREIYIRRRYNNENIKTICGRRVKTVRYKNNYIYNYYGF